MILGVIGMGYVGIPSAMVFAQSGKFEKVYGFQRESERSAGKIRMLNQGKNPLDELEPKLEEMIKWSVEDRIFECTSDFSKIARCDYITICVQTPVIIGNGMFGGTLRDFRDADMVDAIRTVGKHLKGGALVVIESTITPGTTHNIVKSLLEKESGLICGRDFYLSHAPERVMPGKLVENLRTLDRIVGGYDDESTRRTVELYRWVCRGEIIPMDVTAAEVEKTAENAIRDVQIAIANELALLCESMGVNYYDVWRGIDSLKGIGVTRALLTPGAGVGGACLTKDSFHLMRGEDLYGFRRPCPENLFLAARTINDFMPRHVDYLLRTAIRAIPGAVPRQVHDINLAILGWSFIANSGDTRNSPSEVLFGCVRGLKSVRVHDPYVDPKTVTATSVSDNIEPVLLGADAVVVMTGHPMYGKLEPEWVKLLCDCEHPVIIDGRNVIDADSFIRSGFIYRGIGRGDKNSHAVCNPSMI